MRSRSHTIALKFVENAESLKVALKPAWIQQSNFQNTFKHFQKCQKRLSFDEKNGVFWCFFTIFLRSDFHKIEFVELRKIGFLQKSS